MSSRQDIFLAGATGMAGIAILKHLTRNFPGLKVRASYHISPPVFQDKDIEYTRGDLRSLDDCRKLISGCEAVIMAAAYAGGAGFTRSFPWEHMKENLLMNMQVLEASKLQKVKRIILISSSAVYQEFSGNIKEEELDLNQEPAGAYFGFSWAMRFIEELCNFLHRNYGTEIIIVRLANIFGPYARFDPAVSNFIPAIIRKAVDKMEPFEVWGEPQVVRDVLFVDDFARAIALLLQKGEIKFDVFNLGSGLQTTVGEVVNLALEYAGHKPRIINYLKDKPATIKFRALDITKIKERLGWEPGYSVQEGISITTEWWIKNRGHWKK